MGKLYVDDSVSIPAIVKVEEVAKKKFGASIDDLLGDVVDGVLQRPTAPTVLNFAGVRELEGSALKNAFRERLDLTSVDLSSLLTVNSYSLSYAFAKCTDLKSVDLSSLVTVGGIYGMQYAFSECISMTSINLSSLQTVAKGGLQSAFGYCRNLTGELNLSSLVTVEETGLSNAFRNLEQITSINLSSLQSVGKQGLYYAFGYSKNLSSVNLNSLAVVGEKGLESTFTNCVMLTTISFPALTSVQTNSFGTYTFNNCTALTEIHFRADMQATIEALTGYSSKFGATNATISFDLIGTITVDGVEYARDEKQSIRVDGAKTFVGWKYSDGNIVYTDATAEPAVDTVVYSDAGTTQVGTVEAVA